VDISGLCKLKNLTSLRLSDNPNLNFSSFSFNCWLQLKELSLRNTNLKSLNNNYETFAGLRVLSFLDIGKNYLEVFPATNFPELPALGLLFIDNNMLRTLNVTKLNMKFKKLRNIMLSGNQWSCANFEPIEKSLNDFGIQVHDSLSPGMKCVDSAAPAAKSKISFFDIFLNLLFVVIGCCFVTLIFYVSFRK
jgi:hypothetical protein